MLTDTFTIDVDSSLHADILCIMNDNDCKVTLFRRLFCEEQLKAAKCKDARQMQWHPTMIKWCLNLKILSSSAYKSLRTFVLNSLNSYQNVHLLTWFQTEVEAMLIQEA